jgi:hypothetical protein
VVTIPARGYGNALTGGISAARGRYIIMADADDSYDLTGLMPFLEHLRAGSDLVVGNRFAGGIEPGAMPALHRYLGNPMLSFIGRLFFASAVGDFHCGLRGFRRDSALQLGLQAEGMEFASEQVVFATLAGQRITEVPTTLSPAGRSRPPHLRSWRDGWRHLRFLLLFCPRWLFAFPGLALLTVGLLINAAVLPGPLRLGDVTFDLNTLVGADAMMIIGVQSMMFAVFTVVYTSAQGIRSEPSWLAALRRVWTLERGLAVAALLALGGIAGVVFAFLRWKSAAFGPLPVNSVLRLVLPSATALAISCQLGLGVFFLSILQTRRSPTVTAAIHEEQPREDRAHEEHQPDEQTEFGMDPVTSPMRY